MGSHKLSVVITAFDSHAITVSHVKNCMLSTRVPDEIIVVNDHGTPDLKEMLKSIDKKCPLIYAYIDDDIMWNYTGARNLGYWLSRGDILAMEDNDHIPQKDLYENALKFMEANPQISRLLTHRRDKVSENDVVSKPMEEWTRLGVRPSHHDTQFLRREVYMKVKGCDERFTGAYGWACTDWRRRLDRAGIKYADIPQRFWVVIDFETKLTRRKSYRNYEYAREGDGHTQSPIGVLNFKYTVENL